VQSLVVWGFALLGVYHLVFRANLALKRQRAAANSLRDTSNQLRLVMAASFHRKKVMNRAEYRVFKAVEEQVRLRNAGYRVLSQTSLGEIIGSPDTRAFNCINSKRVDILVMSPFGDPVAAVEYQGGEHYQGDAAARDAVKREALRKADVAYIEIFEAHAADDIKRLIDDVLVRAEAQQRLERMSRHTEAPTPG
jgi:hypothetical protein